LGDDIRAHEVCAMSRKLTRERLDLIQRQLTPRDRDLVATLMFVRIASGNQLRRIVFDRNDEATRRVARRELARLVRWRVVERLERRQGGLGSGSESWTYALGVAGQRLGGEARGRRPYLPRPAVWAHALAGAELYAQLVEAVRGTDRAVRSWQGEPECWRDFGGGYTERLRLKPDAFVEVAGPGYVDDSFVEVDMASQSATVIRRKLAAYRSYAATGVEQAVRGGVFPRVVFVVPTSERANVIASLVDDLPAEAARLFAVATTGDAVKLLLGGAS
jgi:hypothetical protein